MNEHPRAQSRPAPTRLRGRLAALLTASPWAAVIFITAGFHVYRGVPQDGVIFAVVGVALVIDALRLVPRTRTDVVVSPVVAVPVAVITGIVLVAAPRYSAADMVTVAVIGCVCFLAAWPGPRESPQRERIDEAAPSSRARLRMRRRTGMLWCTVAVACCLWEVAQYFLGLPSAAADTAHPVISDLLGPLFDSMPGRFAAVAVWMLGGFALLRRGRTR